MYNHLLTASLPCNLCPTGYVFRYTPAPSTAAPKGMYIAMLVYRYLLLVPLPDGVCVSLRFCS
ncbi:hypothetical protein BDZ89DRAFT_1060152 [Hymenopellis radicata]|nr:hypothetical protein BDZ89DRAFT_1060152 [Hymenopellis radicata]